VKAKVIPYFPIVLLIFHAVGFYLFFNSPDNVSLTPLNLLLCGFLVFLSESKNLTALAFVVIFILGFVVELVGIKTGLVFGNYQYTDVLSQQILGVPIIIGVNWFVIVVSSAALFFNLKLAIPLKALLAGLAATLLDFIIEPVAIKYKFWIWENDTVPFYNYVCWFIFSTAFAYLYLRLADKQNRTAFFLYFIWVGFFIALNLL
jgi:putative membrane protein